MDTETERLVAALVDVLLRPGAPDARGPALRPAPPLPRPAGPRPEPVPLEVWAQRHGLG